MHSVILEPTKMILIGTRTTDQATGDAGFCVMIFSPTLYKGGGEVPVTC